MLTDGGAPAFSSAQNFALPTGQFFEQFDIFVIDEHRTGTLPVHHEWVFFLDLDSCFCSFSLFEFGFFGQSGHINYFAFVKRDCYFTLFWQRFKPPYDIRCSCVQSGNKFHGSSRVFLRWEVDGYNNAPLFPSIFAVRYCVLPILSSCKIREIRFCCRASSSTARFNKLKSASGFSNICLISSS